MKDGVLIGIDAGTSVIKAVAFSTQGQQIALASVPNVYVTLPNGGAEQDMALTWANTAKTLSMLAREVPNLKSRAIALAVTGQGDGTWLIDKAGEPVTAAWLWLDARASVVAERFSANKVFAAHYKRTGTCINSCQQSSQLALMKKIHPDWIKRAAQAMHCKDWLYFKLTGQRVTDPSEALYTYGSFKTRSYEPTVLDAMGIPGAKRLLPPIIDGTQVTHSLSREAAGLTGLPAGLPVCLGYLDVICSGIGGGLFDLSGKSGCTIVGSTGMHMRMRHQDDVKLNNDKSGYTMCMPHPKHVAQMQSNMASTINIDWLLDLGLEILKDSGIAKKRSDLLFGMDDKILAEAPGRVIYHPYISLAGERGPFLDVEARASFMGLEVGVGYPALMRSVFEGIAMAARDCYEAMGGPPKEVRVTGGAVKSKALRLMLASALKANVRAVGRDEAGASGAVMMAAVQQKLYPDMPAIAKSWIDPSLGEATKPDTKLARIYDGLFGIYRDMRAKMSDNWHSHAALKRL